MTYSRFFRHAMIVALIAILLALPVVGAGCGGQVTPPPSSQAAKFSAFKVPKRDLDFYVYISQASPTRVPKGVTGAASDILVDSAAIWGVAQKDALSVGGALNFASAADASSVYSQASALTAMTGSWVKLVDRTIYFVQGSGGAAESLKSSISGNDFKTFDDKKALEEVMRLPDSASTRPVAIGVMKPSKELVNMAKKYADPATAKNLDSVFTWARPQVIAIGVYSSQQLEIADLAMRWLGGTIWDADLGMVVLVKSGWPGLVVTPAVSRYLDGSGYTKTTSGGLTVYQTSINPGRIASGRTIPVLLNVTGNRVFATLSGKEAYAQTLMANIRR